MTEPIPPGVVCLVRALGIREPRGIRRVWAALRSSTNPEVPCLLFHLERLWRTSQPGATMFLTAFSPARLAAVLEDLVLAGRLSRGDATTMEEALLEQVTKRGTWK